MANLKNIIELPLAESAEGLNLIVNDSGSAKQIAASEVGAQADFSVTDENSPAFVKNKPFYDTRKYITTPEVTVNGTTIDWGYIKIADSIDFDINKVVSISRYGNDGYKLINVPVVIESSSGKGTWIVTYTDEWDEYWWAVYFSTQEEADMYWGSSEDNPFTTGLYMWLDFSSNENVSIAYSFTYVSSGELKQIDTKYVKDMYYSEPCVDVEVLAEVTKIPEEGNIRIEEGMQALVVDGLYSVMWNGVEYKCQCFNPADGLLAIVNDPFAILYHPDMKDEGFNALVEVRDDSESVTLSITGTYDKVVNKIDEKYMPNSIRNNINDL